MESGVEFNFSFAPGITEQQIVGVELAGEMWANYLGDTQQSIHKGKVTDIQNTVINIHVEIGSGLLPDNVIGGSFPAIENSNKYEKIYDALKDDVTTSSDYFAVDSLTNKKETDVLVNGDFTRTKMMQLTTANLKALNLSSANSQMLDGYIVMSDLSNYQSIDWNYDYLGGPQEGTLDFLSTVTHEIGHTLGFISGTDRIASTSETLGYYQEVASVNIFEQASSIKDNNQYTAEIADQGKHSKKNKHVQNGSVIFEPTGKKKDDKLKKEQVKFEQALEFLQADDAPINIKEARKAIHFLEKYLKHDDNWEEFIKKDSLWKETKAGLSTELLAKKMTSLDLFRYSEKSSSLGANDLTRGTSSYFSLDGSLTDLVMSNGQDYQGSHWQDRERAEGLGIMNPTVALNERWRISHNDLMAMDAIGWDVNYAQPLDMGALYNKASAAVNSAKILNRQKDVDQILRGNAYEGRRTRSAARVFRMSADGYFSTFSESEAAVVDSNEKITAQIDNWQVITNHLPPSFNSLVEIASTDNLNDSLESVEQVAADQRSQHKGASVRRMCPSFYGGVICDYLEIDLQETDLKIDNSSSNNILSKITALDTDQRSQQAPSFYGGVICDLQNAPPLVKEAIAI